MHVSNWMWQKDKGQRYRSWQGSDLEHMVIEVYSTCQLPGRTICWTAKILKDKFNITPIL